MKPRTLAQRLAARHGRLVAIRKAHDRAQRYRAIEGNEPIVTHPFRWLLWTTVLAQLLGTTQSEVIASMQRHRLRLVRAA
jgi:hypothetical protein